MISCQYSKAVRSLSKKLFRDPNNSMTHPCHNHFHISTFPHHCCPGKMKIQTGFILLKWMSRLIYSIRCLKWKASPLCKKKVDFWLYGKSFIRLLVIETWKNHFAFLAVLRVPCDTAFRKDSFFVTQGPQGFRKGRKKAFFQAVIRSHYSKAPVIAVVH